MKPIVAQQLIDCDVHHTWKTAKEVVAYLPRQWREMVEGRGEESFFPISPAITFYPPALGTNKRVDAYSPGGAPPGSDYETLRTQLLDAFPIDYVILSYDIGANGAIPNLYLATQLVSAMNDWSIDCWLNRDDPRLRGAILVPTQIPEDGAREVRRLGSHPKMAEVLLVANGMGKPFGHPVYHPIYEAAIEQGLPVAIHNGGDQPIGTSQMSAGGMPNLRLEFHTLAPQSTIHHFVSFITHGVFEKYPDLKLLLVEIGVSWVPWCLWTLDAHYRELKAESPWIKKLPSEYFRDHVRLSTQPLEASPKKGQLIQLLEAFGGMDDVLMFATDYPHWDTDDPLYISRRLPAGWLQKVFHGNAESFYGRATTSAHTGVAPQSVETSSHVG
jgi:uncharacterized protein